MKLRYFPCYHDEWLVGQAGLDNACRGLYLTACLLMYSHGGPVSIDELRRNCSDHGHAFNRQLRCLINAGKLVLNEGQIVNKRVINELQKRDKRSEDGEQNASKRWNNNQLSDEVALAPSNANQNQNQTLKEKGESNDSPKEKAAALEADFERFWSLYPRRTDKGAARIAYRAARKKTGVAEIETAARRYAANRDGQDPRYTKHPATWLNRESWLNEDDPSPRENGHAQRSPRLDRNAEAERQHAHALDILAQAALDFDERQSGGGPPETPH